MTQTNCNKCGYSWIPRKDKPLCCPKCKSYDWEKGEYELIKGVKEEELSKEVNNNDYWEEAIK